MAPAYATVEAASNQVKRITTASTDRASSSMDNGGAEHGGSTSALSANGHDPARDPSSTGPRSTSSRRTPTRLSRKDTSGTIVGGNHAADGSATTVEDASAGAAAQPTSTSTNAALDPLSQHIFQRTNTNQSIPARLRNRPDSPLPDLARPSIDVPVRLPTSTADAFKDKKKGGSFLSRLSMRGARKKVDEDDEGDEDEDFVDSSSFGIRRTDGTDARILSSIGGGGGFIPHHKEPARYIRVKAHNKKTKDFGRLFLAQELIGTHASDQETSDKKGEAVKTAAGGNGKKRTETGGAVWATEFSKDGKYLAAAGRDHVVRVWPVIATADDRRLFEEAEATNGAPGEMLRAPVFMNAPIREFQGHSGEVLDVSWSKNNFLLSTSMDKTVRLWHVSRTECLCTFKHKELVSKVAFHPRDDRFFLSGCLDTTLRLWSIPDKTVAWSAQLPDLITAVAFSPDGKVAIAGLLNGLCLFYDTDGLKLRNHILVRSSRGKNAKGSKITGIQTMPAPRAGENDVKLLVTSTDSRIRIYNLKDKTLDVKFKGHEHTFSQLSATFSDDGKYVICGSEDRRAFIWDFEGADLECNKDKRPGESFDTRGDVVTTALFAPLATRQLLGGTGDPIYDLCNPPPVTLMSMQESTASQTALSDDVNEAPAAPLPKKPEESPAYIARSTHYDGNIIVTTDDTGIIKVFRQDCAFFKRRQESWDAGSTFSKKLAGGSIIGRSASIMTRTSGGSAVQSRRGSLSSAAPLLGLTSGNSDRILTWRQGIEGEGRPASLVGSLNGTPTRSERSVSPSKAPRSPPPYSVATLASKARQQPYASRSPLASHFDPPSRVDTLSTKTSTSLDGTKPAPESTSRPSSSRDLGEETQRQDSSSTTKQDVSGKSPAEGESFGPPTPSFSFKPADEEDQLRLDPAGASYGFWNLNKWKGIASLRASLTGPSNSSPVASGNHARSSSETSGRDEPGHDRPEGRRKSTSFAAAMSKSPLSRTNTAGNVVEEVAYSGDRNTLVNEDQSGHLAPPGTADGRNSRQSSVVSKLSDELTSTDGEGDGEEMRCTKCGGRDFKARRLGGTHKLACGRCGKAYGE